MTDLTVIENAETTNVVLDTFREFTDEINCELWKIQQRINPSNGEILSEEEKQQMTYDAMTCFVDVQKAAFKRSDELTEGKFCIPRDYEIRDVWVNSVGIISNPEFEKFGEALEKAEDSEEIEKTLKEIKERTTHFMKKVEEIKEFLPRMPLVGNTPYNYLFKLTQAFKNEDGEQPPTKEGILEILQKGWWPIDFEKFTPKYIEKFEEIMEDYHSKVGPAEMDMALIHQDKNPAPLGIGKNGELIKLPEKISEFDTVEEFESMYYAYLDYLVEVSSETARKLEKSATSMELDVEKTKLFMDNANILKLLSNEMEEKKTGMGEGLAELRNLIS